MVCDIFLVSPRGRSFVFKPFVDTPFHLVFRTSAVSIQYPCIDIVVSAVICIAAVRRAKCVEENVAPITPGFHMPNSIHRLPNIGCSMGIRKNYMCEIKMDPKSTIFVDSYACVCKYLHDGDDFEISSFARSLSLYFWIFPLAVLGYSSIQKTYLGTRWLDSLALTQSWTSCFPRTSPWPRSRV